MSWPSAKYLASKAGSSSGLCTCPYNFSHVVSELEIQGHVRACRSKYIRFLEQFGGEVELRHCIFNATHLFPGREMAWHRAQCPDRCYDGFTDLSILGHRRQKRKSEQDFVVWPGAGFRAQAERCMGTIENQTGPRKRKVNFDSVEQCVEPESTLNNKEPADSMDMASPELDTEEEWLGVVARPATRNFYYNRKRKAQFPGPSTAATPGDQNLVQSLRDLHIQ